MPDIYVNIEESDLFDAVDPSDAVSHWGESDLLEEMDIGTIREHAIKNSKPDEVLELLDLDDIKKFLEASGYEVKEEE